MRLFIAFLLIGLMALKSHGKIYGRCELANELVNRYGYNRNTIGDWICLIEHESSYNTRATNDNTNGSRDYGLYQINDYYWCYSSSQPAYNDCNVNCANLIDNNIDDDVACAETIYNRHGFDAWYGYINFCESTSPNYAYIDDCDL